MDREVEEQLQAISGVLTTARRLGARVWLRGGWAMDFLLGRVSRPHVDIDWFLLVDGAERLKEALVAEGFVDLTTAPADQQMDLRRGSIDHGFALLRIDARGVPVVAGGPWGGEPWPQGMLSGHLARLGNVEAPIISAEAQIEIKQMMPTWNPSLSRRQKDLDDVAAIKHSISASPRAISTDGRTGGGMGERAEWRG